MFNVFKGALLALVREKSVFIWSLAFPLILSTMFVFMFANLDEAGQFEPIPTAVVADENYDAAPGFSEMIDTLAEPGADQLVVQVSVSERKGVRRKRRRSVLSPGRSATSTIARKPFAA